MEMSPCKEFHMARDSISRIQIVGPEWGGWYRVGSDNITIHPIKTYNIIGCTNQSPLT